MLSGTSIGNLSTGIYFVQSASGVNLTLATNSILTSLFTGNATLSGNMYITPVTNAYALLTSNIAIVQNQWQNEFQVFT